jgi:hypothetical protein
MFCKQCGRQIGQGGSICRYCGAPADAAPGYGYAGQQAAAGNDPAPKKKKTGLVVALAVIAVLAVALTVAFVLLLKRPGGTDAFTAVDNVLIDLEEDTPAQADEGEGTQDEPGGFDDESFGNSPVSGEPAGSDSSPEAPQQTGLDEDYSTSERPDLSDFLWYVESVFFDGPPEGRTPVSGFAELVGGWKAYIWYDPNDAAGAGGWDFLNINIDGRASGVTVTLDWYRMGMADTGSTLDVTGLADTVLYGDYSQSGLTAGDPGYTVHIAEFYFYNGKQYGVGSISMESGEETYVAMVRP